MSKEVYFKIVELSNSVLHFQIKGFWNDTMVDLFGDEILREWENTLIKLCGSQWIAVPDMSDYQAADQSGRNLLTRIIKIANDYHLFYSIFIAPHLIQQVTVKLTIRDVLSDKDISPAFDQKEAAMLIEKKQKELAAQKSFCAD